jgi:opacity protein-like surface antigen
MKRSPIGIKSIFMVVLVLSLFIPISVFAEPPFYVEFKPGIYSPQSSDLDDSDTGFSGELAFGYRFHPNIAAEVGVGYFNTGGEITVVGPTYVVREKFDIDVVPMTLTLKAILPYKRWEFFGLAGGGIYIAYGPYDYDYRDCDYDYHYDTVLGGYLGGGAHYNITPKLFVGVEGKYLWTGKVEMDEIFGIPLEGKFKMDGIIATAVIGIRF